MAGNEQARALFEQANQAYEDADYNRAMEHYQELLNQELLSDDIHYNLGNSYFKTSNIAEAILHYEKALKINPSHEDAAFNLSIANEKTVDKLESIPELFIYRWWKAIYQLFSIDQWAWLCVLGMFLGSLLFISYLFLTSTAGKKISFYTCVIVTSIALISWIMAAQQKSNLNSHSHAIIMAPTANVISAPTEGSSQLFVLHEGTKVKLKSQVNDWVEIALPNGNKGWVELKALAKI